MDHPRLRSSSTVLSLVLGTATATVILSGCGGGGSSSDVVTSSAAQGTISGNAVKGPVSGATVSVYGLSNGAAGPALAPPRRPMRMAPSPCRSAAIPAQ